MATRPPSDPTLEREFEALYDRTSLRLESAVARVGLATSAAAALLMLAGTWLGSSPPLKVLWLAAALCVWYAWLIRRIGAGHHAAWLRYLSSALEISIGTIVIVFDDAHAGPVFAFTAGGPLMYPISVAAAALRLDPRLCLFASGFGALQSVLMSVLYLRPRWDAVSAPDVAFDGYLIGIRALLLIVLGVFGYVVTRSMRSMLFRITSSAIERERVRGLFGMHVSEEVMEHLLAGGAREGGERRNITVCFTDIRDFTKMSESRAPEEVLRLLNLYFARMCEVVSRHGGVVNKFMGDGMLVIFGAPAALAEDAQKALLAAEEMLQEVERLNATGELPGLRIGVGIHRGEAVVGNVGGSQRQEYTVIGDTVNTASRVQDLTKALGRSIVVTSAVANALPNRTFESLGLQTVKGREQAIDLYAPQAERMAIAG